MTSPHKLASLADLGEKGVTVGQGPDGPLAVGLTGGEPFAVSNRCRHLGAALGEGRIADDGCLECPWHGARYDVAEGTMTRGPQGLLFAPVSFAFRMFTNTVARLRRHDVTVADGDIVLSDD